MSTVRTALALAILTAAPLGAQQWGGGGAPSAAKPATAAKPKAASRRTQVVVVDPTLAVAPLPDPRTTQASVASGGGTYGPIRISNFGGSPPAPAAQNTSRSQLSASAPSSNAGQWGNPTSWSTPTTAGRVVTSTSARLPADSAQHAAAKKPTKP